VVEIKVFPLAAQREMVEHQMSQIHPAFKTQPHKQLDVRHVKQEALKNGSFFFLFFPEYL